MKRYQIYLDPALENALAREARRSNVSRAAVIRRILAERLGDQPAHSVDALDGLVGAYDVEPGDVDATVYDA